MVAGIQVRDPRQACRLDRLGTLHDFAHRPAPDQPAAFHQRQPIGRTVAEIEAADGPQHRTIKGIAYDSQQPFCGAVFGAAIVH